MNANHSQPGSQRPDEAKQSSGAFNDAPTSPRTEYADALAVRLATPAGKDAPGLESTMATCAQDQASLASTELHGESAASARTVRAGEGGATGTRYRAVRFHARGGIGEVHVADDCELGREVALKRIQDHLADDPQLRGRFLREAQVTARLQHPSIVPVYGLVEAADGHPCYAMRFIEGQSLREAIEKFHAAAARPKASALPGADSENPARRERSLSADFTSLGFRKLLGCFLDSCNAIEYAHSRGVVHRDIKPANIMLGEYGETLVVDWGMAKVLGDRGQVSGGREERTWGKASVDASDVASPSPNGDPTSATRLGDILGTPQYMSPEQAEGQQTQVGPASDVYSLGAMLYSVLTGHPAFSGGEVGEVLRKVARGEFHAPRHVQPRVPRVLDAVCLRAMARLSADRYPSARALADDVEHWLADEPVTALRETTGEWIARWGRKHRTFVRAAVAAALVVAAVSGAALVVVDQARRATAKALVAETEAKGAEAAQRRLAETRETQAIDAVKRFRDAVANERELKNSPQLGDLRNRLLKEPLAFFKDLRDRLQSDNDTRSESLARLASASFDLGVLTDEIGDKEDALVAYRESLAVLQKLADDNPAVTEYRRDLATSHNNIGVLLSAIGKPAEVLAAHESALAIRQKLANDNPTVTEFQNDLAASQNNIGLLLSNTGKPAEALAAYESALAILQKLADGNPTGGQFQSGLATSHENIGLLLSHTGKPAKALAAFESALAIRQQLAVDNPTVIQFKRYLADSHISIGNALRVTGNPAEALANYELAVAILQQLTDDNPTVTQLQNDLAGGHLNIGVLLIEIGKPADALAAYESALAIRQKLTDDNPTDTQFQNFLAGSHNNIGVLLHEIGKPAEALAAYQSALVIQQKLADDNPTVTQLQSDMALSHNNVGNLLRETAKPAEALTAYESALAIRQKLADANPTVTQFQSDTARSHNSIGVLLRDTGKPAKALAAFDSALAIQQELADANLTVVQFRNDLAASHNNIGNLLRETAKPAEALAAFESALAIRQNLATEHPNSPEFASDLGVTLNNLAMLDLDSRQFDEACVRLRQAVEWQRKALVANSANPVYRRFLGYHLTYLIRFIRLMRTSFHEFRGSSA